jgi:hypothetical protein
MPFTGHIRIEGIINLKSGAGKIHWHRLIPITAYPICLMPWQISFLQLVTSCGDIGESLDL